MLAAPVEYTNDVNSNQRHLPNATGCGGIAIAPDLLNVTTRPLNEQ